jgi:CRP/FNR family cyclic AMP-dependent transcriptional regulator
VRDTARVQAFVDLARDYPRQSLTPGEALIHDGDPGGNLFILLDGSLRIEKDGVPVAVVAEPGVCVGEMSVLLDVPSTADVIATEATTVACVEHARGLVAAHPELALALARLLAAREQRMTTYLADLQHQYADHEGGLGMVNVVLGSLTHAASERSQLGSERDPEPEY